MENHISTQNSVETYNECLHLFSFQTPIIGVKKLDKLDGFDKRIKNLEKLEK